MSLGDFEKGKDYCAENLSLELLSRRRRDG